jgi:predicted AAA+ superfamily ATPase
MLLRARHAQAVQSLLADYPVVGLIGPRQAGKSTLARALAASAPEAHVFDLEDPADAAALAEAGLVLRSLTGLVVIDEIQHQPGLFSLLRVLADRPDRPATFLVLGSASPNLMRQSADSLAGRIAWHELAGLALDELADATALHVRGGLPPSTLARTDAAADHWRQQYVRALIERDLPLLGLPLAPPAARRFWTMLAHLHGGVLNASELGRAFGASDHAVRRYLDVLTQAMLVRQLQPWHANVGKRQVRAPKVYVADSGLLHTLLGLPNRRAVLANPRLGASWEGFALAQVVARLGVAREQCWFWGTHGGAELDLYVEHGGQKLGFAFKRTETPATSRSMHVALADLDLDRLYVVHAGTRSFDMAERLSAVAIGELWGTA